MLLCSWRWLAAWLFVHVHCLFYADLSGGLRLFGVHWNISVLQQRIAMKPLLCNGRHSVGHVEDTCNVEHQFCGTDGLKRAFKRCFVVDIHPGVTALHDQVFVSLLVAPVYCVRPNTVGRTKWKITWQRWSYNNRGGHTWFQSYCQAIKTPSINVRLMGSERERADWWSHPGRQERGKYLAFLRWLQRRASVFVFMFELVHFLSKSGVFVLRYFCK